MERVVNYILSRFPHQPTEGQRAACEAMVEFLYDADPMAAFVLSGYAGTGKTTLVSALIQSAPAMRLMSLQKYTKMHTWLLSCAMMKLYFLIIANLAFSSCLEKSAIEKFWKECTIRYLAA